MHTLQEACNAVEREVISLRQTFNVATSIRAKIREKGLYQKYVAERSGFTEQQFSDMLNGRKLIRVEYLPNIAAALGVSITELYEVGQPGA